MKSFIKILGVAVTALSLASCLKEDPYFDPAKSNNIVEFANSGTPALDTFPRFTADLGTLNPGESEEFNVLVSYSGPETSAPNDITVNLTIDPVTLELYNDAEGKNYEVPNTSVFEAPTSIVIKKGENRATAKVIVHISPDFDYNANYALPLVITSVSDNTPISSNFGKAIFTFAARNKYDGVYNVTGTYSDNVIGSAATSSYPKTINLVTQGATGGGYFDPNLNGGIYGYSFKNAGSGSYYGNFAPIFYFDDAGNVSKVENYYGQGTNPQLRSAELNPDGINKITFNGAVPEKIEVSYWMVQGTNKRVAITETFTYTGAR
ncbi:DUF1735 domain-containing protein [Flavihumibacter petaseus]|nr:DUF1735 domain-containing protein [Flavihumibacter petaseus]